MFLLSECPAYRTAGIEHHAHLKNSCECNVEARENVRTVLVAP